MMADWIKISMKFTGKCLECGKPIPSGQQGMWSRGVGVKHVQCAEGGATSATATAAAGDTAATATAAPNPAASARITCTICGRPAGCPECEFQDSCDIQNVSPGCLCRECSQKGSDAVMSQYVASVGGRFPVLSQT